MVDKILTFTEVKWHYLTLSWELTDFFPEPGTKIKIKAGGKTIVALINKRKRIRSAKLFKILKPRMGDVLSITKRNHDTYEISLKRR